MSDSFNLNTFGEDSQTTSLVTCGRMPNLVVTVPTNLRQRRLVLLLQPVRLSKARTKHTLVSSVNRLRHGPSPSPAFRQPKGIRLHRPTLEGLCLLPGHKHNTTHMPEHQKTLYDLLPRVGGMFLKIFKVYFTNYHLSHANMSSYTVLCRFWCTALFLQTLGTGTTKLWLASFHLVCCRSFFGRLVDVVLLLSLQDRCVLSCGCKHSFHMSWSPSSIIDDLN